MHMFVCAPRTGHDASEGAGTQAGTAVSRSVLDVGARGEGATAGKAAMNGRLPGRARHPARGIRIVIPPVVRP
jgi:hypothetical protein